MEKLRKFFNDFENAKILDVGTGVGNFIELITELYDKYEKIVGIDTSERLIKIATEHFKDNERIKFVQRDILNTGFPKEHFDIVVLANTLHHLENVEATLENMKSLLKPDGRMLIFEMIREPLDKQQVSHRLIHHFAAKIDRELGRIHFETFSRPEITSMLKKAVGLEILDSFDFEFNKSEPTEENVKALVNQVNAILNQLDEEKREKYIEEAKDIQAYILENSFANATSFVTILKKKN